MHLQFIAYGSILPAERVLELYAERAGRYQDARGLVAKYYLHDERKGRFGGVYFWESREAMEAFWTPGRLADLKAAYAMAGEPRVEDFAVAKAIEGRRRAK